ncbi:MAG TPA: hypothetical protein VK179_15325 [Bacteroidales bacterium]|nr:hypothetical protein [Bacteroidales bacterium]
MQRYLEQLIQDLRKATWKLRPPHELWFESEADPDNEPELEDMSYVEKYIYGEQIPVSEITGIDQENLPPPEMLTDDQKALLSVEMEKMLEVFHFVLDFPADYPMPNRYSFIRNFWNEKHVPLSFGESHIEFCDYDQNACPFPGYCAICNEVARQMEYDNNPKKQDIDPGDIPDWVKEDLP